MNLTDFIFEPAKITDRDQLFTLEQSLFLTDHCSRRNLKYLIQHTTVIVARAQKAGEIVGYAILLGRKNSRKKRIYALGVAASTRNRGIGSKLVGVLETIAGETGSTLLTLEVSDSNKPAILLYNKFGFKQYGFRYSYYQDGGHALLMRKSLPVSLEKNNPVVHKDCGANDTSDLHSGEMSMWTKDRQTTP